MHNTVRAQVASERCTDNDPVVRHDGEVEVAFVMDRLERRQHRRAGVNAFWKHGHHLKRTNTHTPCFDTTQAAGLSW